MVLVFIWWMFCGEVKLMSDVVGWKWSAWCGRFKPRTLYAEYLCAWLGIATGDCRACMSTKILRPSCSVGNVVINIIKFATKQLIYILLPNSGSSFHRRPDTMSRAFCTRPTRAWQCMWWEKCTALKNWSCPTGHSQISSTHFRPLPCLCAMQITERHWIWLGIQMLDWIT